MKKAIVLTFIVLLIMAFAIIYGFVAGDFANEGNILLSIPWGKVSLLDIYASLTLFSAWIVFRERSLVSSIIWVLFLIAFGSFGVGLYVFIALLKSEGNWNKFFLGKQKR